MCLDDGLGLDLQRDLIQMGGEYIDFAKIAVGTSRLISLDILKQKIELYRTGDIEAFPGGQFLEYAFLKDSVDSYYGQAKEAGYNYIEVSDNIISLTPDQKAGLIKRAVNECGLKVLGEVGKKEGLEVTIDLIDDIKLCLEAGASFVFVEAAELFGEELNTQLIRKIGKDIDYNQVIFELPGPWISGVHLCDIHRITVWLVDNLGPDVNVANVDHHNLLALETLRRGIGTNAGVSH